MRTVLHVSDIHFGRIDYDLVEPLIALAHEMKPDLVAISGDLTQRARAGQFQEARAFLDRLPTPRIVVPGNHDIPLHNLVARFAFPLRNYRRYITEDLSPCYEDEEIIAVGVNTARSFTRKHGRINLRQVGEIEERLARSRDGIVKIIVTHHPFDVPPGHDERDIVGRAKMAMESLAKCGADLFLAGHLHISRTSNSSERYRINGHSALVIQAGTISQRARGESAAFNVIRVNRPEVTVQRYEWIPEQKKFEACAMEKFLHSPAGWVRQAAGF